MLLREDFYKILRDTIMDYARAVLQKEIKCEYEPFDDSEAWSINATLGFVARTPVPKGVRTYMKSEYNVRGSIVKNVIGKAAVDVITAFPSIGTTKKVYVSRGVFNSAIFIVPQNRSIRFYDYEQMTVDCIIKSGFTSKYFNNQIDFRTTYSYDFLNPMLANGNGWFREKVLLGHPLVRTTDKELFEKGTKKALDYLKVLAKDTVEFTPVRPYFDSMKEDATRKTELAKEKKKIREADATLKLLDIAEKLANSITTDIPTCISHGDFQSGNIWIEPSGNTLVYDWETAGRRSIWYDSATLSYSLRRAFGWESMISDSSGEGLMKCVPDGVDAQMDRRGIIGVLLLEDILFYLDDLLELPNDWGHEGFDGFIARQKILNWNL